MEDKLKKICIVGAGGFGREVASSFKSFFRQIEKEVVFMVDEDKFTNSEVLGVPVIITSAFIPAEYDVVIAVGDPFARKKIVERLPAETTYTTLIHPNATVMEGCEIGAGTIITTGCIITCNIRIGKHSHFNLNTTIGHDCTIGDYFTTAPGTNISGNCEIGDCVYFGTNTSVRPGVKICDDAVIGMGGVVVKNIIEKGTYIGNPLRKMEHKG